MDRGRVTHAKKKKNATSVRMLRRAATLPDHHIDIHAWGSRAWSMVAQKLFRSVGLEDTATLALGRRADVERARNRKRKLTPSYLARRVALKRRFVTWKAQSKSVHGYCDADEYEDTDQAGEGSMRKVIRPAAKRRRVSTEIAGQCPQCLGVFKTKRMRDRHAQPCTKRPAKNATRIGPAGTATPIVDAPLVDTATPAPAAASGGLRKRLRFADEDAEAGDGATERGDEDEGEDEDDGEDEGDGADDSDDDSDASANSDVSETVLEIDVDDDGFCEV